MDEWFVWPWWSAICFCLLEEQRTPVFVPEIVLETSIQVQQDVHICFIVNKSLWPREAENHTVTRWSECGRKIPVKCSRNVVHTVRTSQNGSRHVREIPNRERSTTAVRMHFRSFSRSILRLCAQSLACRESRLENAWLEDGTATNSDMLVKPFCLVLIQNDLQALIDEVDRRSTNAFAPSM